MIPNCPACKEQRAHTEEDWKHHPERGHGFAKEVGWTGGVKPSILPPSQSNTEYIAPQPPPSHNTLPAVWDLVISDMRARNKFGRDKYGTPLQPHNGRDALSDAFQEALDLCVYLRQAIFERDGR